ncbi:PS-10 peptidase S37 [Apibacter mensalis]|uniref:PS-10 peptidase S37 n=1 Tax=Apibacter mensalis TaxID=1586267 RepID=A0A0X3AN50_9FLAO|nr:S28 family serine protease [Apibacter mensalis]CVK15485.1 PS-10 peptidase S37 [Apibacter mensalis]
MKRIHLFIIILFSFYILSGQESDRKKLEEFLSKQQDLTFEKIETLKGGPLKYKLSIKQPLDWSDPLKNYFNQQVILTHTGFNNPMVMDTQGYQMYNVKNELQQILNSNFLNIEHRYFGESTPDSIIFSWKYLTLNNVAHDLHHINEIFKKIYGEKWISTGISKGGQTTIYYRYFFPEDVDVSIPYVAPINYSLEDPRIYDFLDHVGTEKCRKKIKDFQLFLLRNEEEALKYVKAYSDMKGLTYNYVGSIGKAFEYTVLEYPFSFWQWGYSCDSISQLIDIAQGVDYLINSVDISFFSDQEIKQYAPHYYQAAVEMGYYGYDVSPFKDYLNYFNENPLAVFPPKEAGKITFSSKLNANLKNWLNSNGNNFIYIYGELDTWSATKVIPTHNTNSIILELVGANHASARIKNMNQAMRQQISDILYQWIGIRPNYDLLY